MQLSDKYTLERGSVYLTGIQALVRLPMDQMRRDRAAGLHTGAFISGYEGSPLGGYDLSLGRVRGLLEPLDIHFVPGVNEELAATAVMGSQIHQVLGKGKFDGVVGIWYGKGPGVDRSGDIFRHANLAGTGENCGALILAGDDHVSKSSTIPHQSDFSLLNHGIPFFYPGNTQEIVDYGLLAIALSRYSGAWVGMKMITDICDGGGSVAVDPARIAIQYPVGYKRHVDARLVPPITLGLEHEVNVRRLEAARQFVRLNRLNRISGAREGARIGIVSAGKSYYDLMQSLRDLGVGEEIRIGKVAMPFPLDPEWCREFAEGLETILVVEEKRSFLEWQFRDALYEGPDHPHVIGKKEFPPTGELDPDKISVVLSRLLKLPLRMQQELPRVQMPARPAAFCSGCPHNRSTLLLPGQVAGGGIGCHTMAIRLQDESRTFSFVTQMGGEGTPWIGMAPFVERGHVFQNIGDGTFFHSGSLAVQACIAAGVNVTYKILYNGHVAMTGGQMASGALPVPALTKKLEAEGVKKIVVLAEDLDKYEGLELAGNAELRSRDELAPTMLELEKVAGVTVIIYDQECAAEKRRKRSRGSMAEPTQRLVIHEEVCEGCGDCVKQSNCMSLHPVPTPRGQKMRIHQSSCNKDETCALGDCPSFVSVKLKAGTGLRKRPTAVLPQADVPAPRSIVSAGDGYRILSPGVGGTGVITINALLATAAWLDGLSVGTLDQTGTAQKGGAVVAHLLLSDQPIMVPPKCNAGNANLILGFDLMGAAQPEHLKTAHPERTVAVVNSGILPTIDSIRSRTPLSGSEQMVQMVNAATRPGHNVFVDANRIAEGLFGSHMAANLFLLGVAWQGGLIPVSLESMKRAIELNGVAVERNQNVFSWGRKYYEDAAFVEAQIAPPKHTGEASLDRVAELTAYQNEAYAREFTEFVESVPVRLRDSVARNLFKLMAYKDEYEVARLLTKPEFEAGLREQWESMESLHYHLHPPLLRRFGVKKKIHLGPWFRTPLRILAKLKMVRGSALDIFGYSAHRREERELIRWYRDLVAQAQGLPDEAARQIAELPDQIRGYEQIKVESIARAKAKASELLTSARTPQPTAPGA